MQSENWKLRFTELQGSDRLHDQRHYSSVRGVVVMLCTSLALCLCALRDFGRVQRVQTTSGLRLELRQVGTASKNRAVVRFEIINRGTEPVLLDPAVLGSETMRIVFTRAGNHVKFKGEEMRAYTPLNGNDAVWFAPGQFVGWEKRYELEAACAGLKVSAWCWYEPERGGAVQGLWIGQLQANPITLR